MSGHRPFSELTRDFSPERKRRNAKGSARLGVKIQIAKVIGEDILRENDVLSDLLCETELDFADKELLQAIEQQIQAVEGTEQALTPDQLKRIDELTAEIRNWIALAASVKV